MIMNLNDPKKDLRPTSREILSQVSKEDCLTFQVSCRKNQKTGARWLASRARVKVSPVQSLEILLQNKASRAEMIQTTGGFLMKKAEKR